MKVKKILTTLALESFFALPVPLKVLAADINIEPGNEFNTIRSITVSSLVGGIVRLLLVIAALVFFIMLVIGGIQWIMSGGDKAASENARKRITSALVGLAIVFSAWAIAQLIRSLFGVEILNVNLPKFYQ